LGAEKLGKWAQLPFFYIFLRIELPYKTAWWYTYPSEKYESQIGSSSQLLGKIKNAPNHQPGNYVHNIIIQQYNTM
jgi:hypothetical protein